MIDQKLNERIPELVSFLTLSQITDTALIDEYLGEWDKLFERRIESKSTYDMLFSLCNDVLTDENKAEIAKLRKNVYPSFLCGLAKCYMVKGQNNEAISILQEAMDIGSIGAQTLLGVVYFEMSDGQTSYNLLKSVNIISETVTKEVNNERFQAAAMFYLAIMHRIVANDVTKSYETLMQIINSDWSDDLKEGAKQEIGHYKKGFLCGLKYIN